MNAARNACIKKWTSTR